MTAWVDGWQMQCCGEPFRLGSQAAWPLRPAPDWLEEVPGNGAPPVEAPSNTMAASRDAVPTRGRVTPDRWETRWMAGTSVPELDVARARRWCEQRVRPMPMPGTSSGRSARPARGTSPSWNAGELRTSFVSLMSHRAVNIEEIARLVGHASTPTTEVAYRRELRPVITAGTKIMD